jgi:predicted metal-dependent hydrolase
MNISEEYAIYYIVHEVCHFKHTNERGHGKEFKSTERKALDSWGIEIEYSRAYPKKLYHNGQCVYDRKKDK